MLELQEEFGNGGVVSKGSASIRHFVIAARHIALLQVSSACVERVFSQVTLICDTCGVNPL